MLSKKVRVLIVSLIVLEVTNILLINKPTFFSQNIFSQSANHVVAQNDSISAVKIQQIVPPVVHTADERLFIYKGAIKLIHSVQNSRQKTDRQGIKKKRLSPG